MNLRTITAKLKAFGAAAKALARGVFSKSQRGVEWHRLTHDRYPWVVAFISLAMVLVMLRIVFFILSRRKGDIRGVSEAWAWDTGPSRRGDKGAG